MPFRVKLNVLSFINLGRHKAGEEIIIDDYNPKDERYELIEEVAEKKAPVGKKKAADFLK
jgi:hypothetical protein